MIDLRPDYLYTVKRILADHVPDCEVRAFGSRAAWISKDYSDLDLTIVGVEPLGWRTLSQMEEAFEESSLPIRVDVLDWHTISQRFRQVIEQGYVVLQKVIEPADLDRRSQWRRATLDDVIDLRLSSVDKKSKESEVSVRLCNYTDVYYNSFIRSDMAFMTQLPRSAKLRSVHSLQGMLLLPKILKNMMISAFLPWYARTYPIWSVGITWRSFVLMHRRLMGHTCSTR